MATSGLNEALSNTKKIMSDIADKKALRAVHIALSIGAVEAAVYTPIRTSNLINGQYKKIKVFKGKMVLGWVGYMAKYAPQVHDPNFKQRFRRASAKKEFLTKGFEENRARIIEAMRREMKV